MNAKNPHHGGKKQGLVLAGLGVSLAVVSAATMSPDCGSPIVSPASIFQWTGVSGAAASNGTQSKVSPAQQSHQPQQQQIVGVGSQPQPYQPLSTTPIGNPNINQSQRQDQPTAGISIQQKDILTPNMAVDRELSKAFYSSQWRAGSIQRIRDAVSTVHLSWTIHMKKVIRETCLGLPQKQPHPPPPQPDTESPRASTNSSTLSSASTSSSDVSTPESVAPPDDIYTLLVMFLNLDTSGLLSGRIDPQSYIPDIRTRLFSAADDDEAEEGIVNERRQRRRIEAENMSITYPHVAENFLLAIPMFYLEHVFNCVIEYFEQNTENDECTTGGATILSLKRDSYGLRPSTSSGAAAAAAAAAGGVGVVGGGAAPVQSSSRPHTAAPRSQPKASRSKPSSLDETDLSEWEQAMQVLKKWAGTCGILSVYDTSSPNRQGVLWFWRNVILPSEGLGPGGTFEECFSTLLERLDEVRGPWFVVDKGYILTEPEEVAPPEYSETGVHLGGAGGYDEWQPSAGWRRGGRTLGGLVKKGLKRLGGL